MNAQHPRSASPFAAIARARPGVAQPARPAGLAQDLPAGGEYMNRDQLAWFEKQLRAKRARCLAMLSGMHADMPQAEQFADPSDKASSLESSELAAAQGGLVKAELHAIDAALGRIASGDYGFCEDTGEEIGLARLVANPTATRTVEAQSAVEAQLRMRAAA